MWNEANRRSHKKRNAGDGVKITKPGKFTLQSGRDADVLMFDLP